MPNYRATRRGGQAWWVDGGIYRDESMVFLVVTGDLSVVFLVANSNG